MKPDLAVTGAALAMAWLGCSSVAVAHDGAHDRPELAMPRTAEYDYDLPEPGSYPLPVVRPAADGQVLDEAGAAHRLHALLEGKLSVLAFVYTRCADVCPLAMTLLYELHDLSARDRDLHDNLQLVTLSFDPAHDTPEVMAMHATALANTGDPGASWRFLTTASQAALQPILDAYDQPVARKPDPADPFGPFAHQLRVFLIDREGFIRNIYSLGFLDPRLVVVDVRTLLLQEQAAMASSGG